jgi:hypothetical protein
MVVLNKIFGGQSDKYHLFHRILIGIITLIVLYHLFIMKLETQDQIMFLYIILFEIIGIGYEYFYQF